MIIPNEIQKLFYYFNDGYITSDWTFNFQSGTVSIPLSSIDYEHDIPKLLLAFSASEICYGKPFLNPIRNYCHRVELRNRVNRFLGTTLRKADFEIIANQCSNGHNLNVVQDIVLNGFNRNYIQKVGYAYA